MGIEDNSNNLELVIFLKPNNTINDEINAPK